MIESQHNELFLEPRPSMAPKILAAVAALVITALVIIGYTALRRRHAQSAAQLALSTQPAAQPQLPPKVLVMVDEALLQGGKTTLGGTVRNTSAEKLEGISIELELKRRKDGVAEVQLVALQPPQLEPQQEGRYVLQLRAQDYSSARLLGLRAGTALASVPFATAPGQKRPLERLETKTVTVGKPSSSKRGGEFLNTQDNPARVP